MHRNADQLVAGLARELAHALALGAQNERHRAGQVHVVNRLFSVVAGAYAPDVALLQLVQRARQVRHHEIRHGFGRAAGDLGDRGVDAGGMVLGRDHGLRASAVGHPQAGAQIVRVGHAVEHQQQGLGDAGLFKLLQQLIERCDLGHGIDARDHALMAVAAAHLGQAQAIALDHANAGFADAVGELAHAGIAARNIIKNLQHRLGRGFEANTNGMETEKNFVGGRRHRAIIAAGRAKAVAAPARLKSASASNTMLLIAACAYAACAGGTFYAYFVKAGFLGDHGCGDGTPVFEASRVKRCSTAWRLTLRWI